MDEHVLLKMVLLGDESVGKSGLLDRIIYNTFKAEMSPTISLAFATKTMMLTEHTSVRLQIWDIAGNNIYKARDTNYCKGVAIVGIVLDATNTRKDEQSKIAQVKKYKKQIDEVGDNKIMVLVIDNKSDCATAAKMDEDELSQLESFGIDRSHYIYASAKTNQANDLTITDCLTKFVQGYVDANPNIIRRNSNYVSFNLPPASSHATLPLLSSAWWIGLFSSAKQRGEFYGVSRVRQQINQLSNEQAIAILQEMHKHLMKGTANAVRHKPFELSCGGGIDAFYFVDKSTQKEVLVEYKNSFPHHCIPWLIICVPYVHYEAQLPAVYVSGAKNELLQLFNSVIATTSNLKAYCRRYPSTQEFYNELPNFLISQIRHNIPNADAALLSSVAATSPLR